MQETYSLVNNTCMEIKASASSFLKSSINFLMIFLIVLSMHSIFLKIYLSREKDQLFPWNLMNFYKSLWNFKKFQKRFKCHFSKKIVEHWSLVKTCEFWIEWNQISDMGDHTSTFYVYMFWWTAFKDRIAILLWNVLHSGKEKFWNMHDPSRTVAISLHFPL